MANARHARSIRRTLLIIGEGNAEEALLRHVRTLYTRDRNGPHVTVRNARGKGAAHVVDFAIRQSVAAEFDRVAAMLDTDTDWNDVVARRARAHGIDVLQSKPCLEAWLLDAKLGRPVQARDFKAAFKKAFGGDAHDAGLLARQLDQPLLERARHRIDVLDQLLRLLGG